MGIILSITAILLTILISPIGFLYSIFRMAYKNNLKEFFNYFNTLYFKLAISIDQLGNVFCQHILNDTLIKNKRNPFGYEDETISSVLGKNKFDNNLTKFGKLIANTLDFLDNNHCYKSIEHRDRWI